MQTLCTSLGESNFQFWTQIDCKSEFYADFHDSGIPILGDFNHVWSWSVLVRLCHHNYRRHKIVQQEANEDAYDRPYGTVLMFER